MSVQHLWRIGALTLVFIGLSIGPVMGASPPGPEQDGGSILDPLSDSLVTVDNTTELLSTSQVNTAGVAVAVYQMSQGFEGVWPAPHWTLVDASSSDGGEYLWGKRRCHPHSGSYAGWSVGGGVQGSGLPCSAAYPNNANTAAIYGPFDLSEATSASLRFHLWGRTRAGSGECPWDYLFVGSSTNGASFSGTQYCGDGTNGSAGNGYHQASLDLSGRLGKNQVWIAFAFVSDGAGTDLGFTIDDVSLSVDDAGSDEESRFYLPGVMRNWTPPTPAPSPTPSPLPELTCLYVVNWWWDASGNRRWSDYSPACLMAKAIDFHPIYGTQGQWIGYTAAVERQNKPDFEMDATYIFNSAGGVTGIDVIKTYVGGSQYHMRVTQFCPPIGLLSGYKASYNSRETTYGYCVE